MNFLGFIIIFLFNESEFCLVIWGYMYYSFDVYFKSFYFFIFFSGVIRLNKDGFGEIFVGFLLFGKFNGIFFYY